MEQTNWPDTIVWHEKDDRQRLSESLSVSITEILKSTIAEKGEALLVVSGGSTPKPFFKALSEQTLPWHKVTVSLADERFVDKNHADSNERLVRENLLIGNAAEAKFLSLYHPVANASAAAAKSAEQFSDMMPDVLVLGMGNDGHTASLFPGSPLLEKALDKNGEALCLPMTPQDAPHDRVTMTFSLLAKSKHTFLHIVGEDKKATLARACELQDPLQMPIWAFLNKPIQVFWSE